MRSINKTITKIYIPLAIQQVVLFTVPINPAIHS